MRFLLASVLVLAASSSVFAKPSPMDFTKVTLTTSNPQKGTSQTVIVHGTGRAELQRSSKTGKFAPITGRAEQLDFIRLKYFILGAKLGTIPASIPSTHSGAARPLTLEVIQNGKTDTTRADYEHYGQYKSRLDPLVNAVVVRDFDRAS
ncbi:MAG: hypothetical protein ACAI25_00435, partial [Planctomycetota bacterium]